MPEDSRVALRKHLAINFPRVYAAVYDAPPGIFYGVVAAYFLLPAPAHIEVEVGVAHRLLQGIKAREAGIEPPGEIAN